MMINNRVTLLKTFALMTILVLGSLTIIPRAECITLVYWSTDVPKHIPDMSTIFSNLDVPRGGFISDVNVNLTIQHTWDSDLFVYLISPSATSIMLFAYVGGAGDDFIKTVLDDEATTPIASGSAPFTGSFQPQGALANLKGEGMLGTWQLQVSDVVGLDVGDLIC